MFSFDSLKKSSAPEGTIPMSYESHVITVPPPEPVGTILGKVGVVWAGLFAGISLGDVVLIATLVYTILQICLAVYERIIKPIYAVQEAARLVKQASESKEKQS